MHVKNFRNIVRNFAEIRRGYFVDQSTIISISIRPVARKAYEVAWVKQRFYYTTQTTVKCGVFLVVPFYSERPERRDVTLGRMRIVGDDHIRIIEKRARIKKAAVRRNSYPVRVAIFSLGGRLVFVFCSGEPQNRQAVFLFGLLDHLVDKLTGWTEIDDAFSVPATSPFVFPLPVGSCSATSGELMAWDT